MLSPRFTRAAHNVTILTQFANVECSYSSFTHFTTWFGIIPFKIMYLFFISPVTLSIWILTEATFLVDSISQAESCFLPLVKAEIISSLLEFKAKSFWKVNSLSANIWSPGIWKQVVVKPDSLTIWISEACPPQHFEKNWQHHVMYMI